MEREGYSAMGVEIREEGLGKSRCDCSLHFADASVSMENRLA